MIVEDDTDMRNLLIDNLLRKHYEIIQAEDGEQAINKAVSHKPHLILLDLMLPKMGGFEVLDFIRKNDDMSIALIPVVILSNLSREKDFNEAQKLKVEKFFVKANTEIEAVLKHVEEVLNRS